MLLARLDRQEADVSVLLPEGSLKVQTSPPFLTAATAAAAAAVIITFFMYRHSVYIWITEQYY